MDQLSCRRARECCVQLHSCVQKWRELNSSGFDVATRLVNVITQNKYTDHHSSHGVLKDQFPLHASLECKLIEERERLFTEMQYIAIEMAKVVERMGSLSGNLKALAELVAAQGEDPAQPLFQTLTTKLFGVYSEDLFQAYSQELSVKWSIVNDLLKQTDRDTLTVYLSCWLHQPYIDHQSHDKLEAMLIDSGLRT